MGIRRLLAVLSCLAAACGGGASETLSDEPPPRVPDGLVPDALGAEELRVRPYAGEEAQRAFAEAGEQALVADGRLWEIRDGETLVGVLQISTLKNRVDLAEEDQRDAIVGRILSGGTTSIEVEAVTVFFSETEDQTKYVWFGRRLFEVLTLKSSAVEPEPIVTELVRFQLSREVWEPLPTPTEEPD